MELDKRYKKRHLAMMLIESDGWIKDIPDTIESKLIYSDGLLDNDSSDTIHRLYSK